MPAASRFGPVPPLSDPAAERRGALAILVPLAALAGLIGALVPGPGYGQLPLPGLHLPLVGLWFGLTVGFAAWRWGRPPHSAAVALWAFAATWIGWQAAVELAVRVDRHLASVDALSPDAAMALAGVAAGALGAWLTWAGVAVAGRRLRRPAAAFGFVAAGAVFGLLLPLANRLESFALLLAPWQMAVAAGIALGLTGAAQR